MRRPFFSQVGGIEVGFFSWFSVTARKSVAAALIQIAYEALAKGGILDSQPEALANRVVEAAFTRIPNLANAKYNKHILAVSILVMVPALPSFSANERESSKHALGMLLKHVLELQMSNSLALTLSEQGLLERAQQAFLATMEPAPGFNLGPSFDEAPAVALDLEKFSRVAERRAILIEAESSIECIALEHDYIDKAYGAKGPWTLLTQSLVEADGSVYDKFEIVLADGANKTVWFDITFSWEKWRVPPMAIQAYRCPRCDCAISSEQAQAKKCPKCDSHPQQEGMLNTTNRQGVELPRFTPRARGKNLDTAIAEPSAKGTGLLPLLAIAGTLAILVAVFPLNEPPTSSPSTKVTETKAESEAPPQLATLSDVLRGLGHSWDERNSEGKILYQTMPKGEKLENLRQYIGQPLLLKLIHTVKLLDSSQELLFFSSTPIPKDPKETFDCHVCAPLLSAMVVSQIPGKGLVATVPLEPIMFVGEWGKINMDGSYAPTIVEIGPKVTGFTLLHTESHHGEIESWTTLHAIKGNRLHALGAFDSESDNLGAMPCYEKRTRETCRKSSTRSTFIKAAKYGGYYELQTDTDITYVDNGVEEYATSKARLRFNGKHYAPVETAAETLVAKTLPSADLGSSGGTESLDNTTKITGAPAPVSGGAMPAPVAPLVNSYAVRQSFMQVSNDPAEIAKDRLALDAALETSRREKQIQHENKPSFPAAFGARLSGNTSVRTPPQGSDGTNVVAASSLPSKNSKTPEEQIVVIVKRKLKDTAPLTRTEHAEFWRLMNSYSPAEQANLLRIVRVNLLGAAKFHAALIESAAISASNGKVVKTAELIELTAETRRVFLTTLPDSLAPAQRENLVKMYDEKRVITDRNNDSFLRSAAEGKPHTDSEQRAIATDAESLRTYPAVIKQGINRVLRLIDPIWKDETKAQQ